MKLLTLYSLLVLSGVCLYAVINHLSIGLRRPRNLMHLAFAGTCLFVMFAIYGRVNSDHAQNVPEFLAALRWNLSFIFLSMTLLPWVIADYTGTRPRRFLIGMSAFFASTFVWNLIAPYTVQFTEVTGLSSIELPWGEKITVPVCKISPAAALPATALLVSFGFALFVLYRNWRVKRDRPALAMLLAMAFFLSMVIEGIAARASAINFVHLGWIGFLGMIITMSFVLSHDTQKRLRISEQRFRSLLEQSPFAIQVFAPDGHVRHANPAWKQLWHNNPENLSEDYNILNDQYLIANDVMPYINEGFSGTAHEIPPVAYELNNGSSDTGSSQARWLRSHIYPIKSDQGMIRDIILMHEDVTERKRIEDAVRLIAAGVSSAVGEQFFEQLVLNLARVFDADYAFIALQDKQEWQKLNMIAACDHGKITNNMNYSLACVPFWRILKEGTAVYPQNLQQFFPDECALTDNKIQALIGTPIHTADDQHGLLVVMHREPIEYVEQASEILDIFAVRVATELKQQQAQQHMRDLAYQDFLTGLPNRAQLLERLTAVIQNVDAGRRAGALLLIDLDHFKTINDALGHEVGDEVLGSVARRIMECCDSHMFMARFGGDEFVALIEKDPGISSKAFDYYVDKVTQGIQTRLAEPINTGDRVFTLGISIGVVHFPRDGQSDLDILRHADMALHEAKRKGRGIAQHYQPALEVAANERLQIEAGLRTAIENNELYLNYQPQINRRGELYGTEVLLRWKHSELGRITPDRFIPVAEESGLIYKIGSWVLDQACANLMEWQKQGIPFHGHLSVNVCPWQFARPDFVSTVKASMKRHEVDPKYLMLEITETALLYDIQEAIDKLIALRRLGLRVALDDFGTGYSSLAYLRDLPLDQLKIDKSFINELDSTAESPLVESMLAIGKHMKLTVVAEGVETDEQHNNLLAMGCEHFQGYLFCRPLPEQEFLSWLALDTTLPQQSLQQS